MPTILRSSAGGKLSEGSTTTVPSPRSSGSLAGYRAAKVRRSSSKGTNGGADHIANDNQSAWVLASPGSAGSSWSAVSPDGRRRRRGAGIMGRDDPGDALLRRGRRRGDLPAAGGRLLPPRGHRPC